MARRVWARHAVPIQIVERDFGDSVAGRIEALHRLQECGVLLLGWHELDHQRPVHVFSIPQTAQWVPWKDGSRPSSPRLKAGASGRR